MTVITRQSAVSPSSAAQERGPRPSPRMLLLAALGALALLATAAAPALAAKPSGAPSEHGHGKGGQPGGGKEGGGGGGETGSGEMGEEVGADISYPQCGGTFPSGQAFGIVGVNDGLANTLNPCLGLPSASASPSESELYWAAVESKGGVAGQPTASLYVNTADPGNVYDKSQIEDWPTEGGNSTYGACKTETVRLRGRTVQVGEDSAACAWQYGNDRATEDIRWLREAAEAVDVASSPEAVPTTAPAYQWWLDVETANTWQSGAAGQQMNVADLRGMLAAFKEAGAEGSGVYSTESQWNQITGGTPATETETLYGLPVWIPGAGGPLEAESNCALQAFTGGSVQLTQWLSGSFDADHYCAVA